MLIEEALNVVSVIYARVYFPTYSNGLKDIAQYLGFRWSDSIGCSLNSVFWRHDWQLSKDPSLKRKLIRYNLEDCLALQTVTNALKKSCTISLKNTHPVINESQTQIHWNGKTPFVLVETHF